MCFPPACALESPVALLTEGVDRNRSGIHALGSTIWSPSSRRAWIEITVHPPASLLWTSPSSRRA